MSGFDTFRTDGSIDFMTKQRNGIIDLMRFIFCIGIVFGHGRYLGNPTGTVPFAQGGYLGVEFYFLVSGFLMA